LTGAPAGGDKRAVSGEWERKVSRIFSGVQPTGNLHLGNYLGAIRNWVRMQAEAECLFCIVDLHALTQAPDPAALRAATRETWAAYVACGIDDASAIIFHQSAVPGHAELSWLLQCVTPMGWLGRMTQFKEKAGKKRDAAPVGLFSYPVLMAADILLYKATDVPVGEDQKQHLELARDIAGAFNRHVGRDIFPEPEPRIFETAARVMSLRDGTRKMSKSDESDFTRINLTDDADLIAQKIRKAKTDPAPLPESPDGLTARPEAENLVGVYAALSDSTPAAVLSAFGGRNFSDFKPALADLAVDVLAPIASEMQRLLDDPAEIDRRLAAGADRADAIAAKVMAEAREAVGLLDLRTPS